VTVTVFLPGYLRPFADGRSSVELDGSVATVGEALRALGSRHPGVYDRVVTERGELRPHVNLFLSGKSIRYSGGLATPVSEDCQLVVLAAVSGG